MTTALSTNRFGLTPFIVDPVAYNGFYTTIASAITAAAAAGGGNIFIKPGTYTEDLTFQPGCNLYTFTDPLGNSDNTQLVTIQGSHTYSGNLGCDIKSINFTDNGVSPTISVGDPINIPELSLEDCVIQSTVGDAFVNGTNANTIAVGCNFSGSSSAITMNAGGMTIIGGLFIAATSIGVVGNGGFFSAKYTSISGGTAGIRVLGSPFSINSAYNEIAGGGSFAVDFQGFVATMKSHHDRFYSTDASGNAIGGTAATFIYSNNAFTGTSYGIASTLTQVYYKTHLGTILTTYKSINNASSPYSVQGSDQYIGVDTSGGAVTVRLQNSAEIGQTYTVKDSSGNAGANNITLTTVGGVVLIDGAASQTINTNFGSLTVLWDGTKYEIY